MAEKKRDRFVRLATARMNRAIRDVRLVGNLSNRNHYDYDEADIRKIIRALEEEVRALKARFDSSSDARGAQFKLD